MTLPLHQRHIDEVKVRLTEKHKRLLEALAINNDVPTAVLARHILVTHLEQFVGNASASRLSELGEIGRS